MRNLFHVSILLLGACMASVACTGVDVANDDGAAPCEEGAKGCEGVWRTLCENGVWLKTFDCAALDRVCQEGKCVVPDAPSDGDIFSDGDFPVDGDRDYPSDGDVPEDGDRQEDGDTSLDGDEDEEGDSENEGEEDTEKDGDEDEDCGPYGCNPDCGGVCPDGVNSRGVCVFGDNGAPVCVFQCKENYWDLDGNDSQECEYFCEFIDDFDLPDDDSIDANCDGYEFDLAGTIFVAHPAAGATDENPGTMQAPKASILAALDEARADPTKYIIIVSAGVYPGSLQVVNAVSLHGGYCWDFETGEWEKNKDVHYFEVRADTPGGNHIGVMAQEIRFKTVMEYGKIIVTNGGEGNRGSNYGIHLRNTPALTLKNLTIKVDPPQPRTPPSAGGVAGLPGNDGSNGGGSNCSCDGGALPTQGAGASIVTCPSSIPPTAGGKGGATRRSGSGYAGTAGASGGGVAGGGGTSATVPGKSGGKGSDGANGIDAPGGANFGTIVDGFYVPADAPDANTDGAGGKGGGGGGGGFGATWTTDGNRYCCAGGAGGGGGSGGCGGTRGKPGKGGYGVFGIFVVGPPLEIKDCSIVVSKGGDGGVGGGGPPGGNGGKGVGGGNLYYQSSSKASGGGAGGDGGKGGRGGHGGGGGGGPSFCMWTTSPTTPPQAQNVFCTGYSPGKGGKSLGNAGADGLAGVKNW